MRPVNRKRRTGAAFKVYRDALLPLVDALGPYCSYCERPVDPPDVEHIRPKNKKAHPKLTKEWSNLLLACKNCNSNKGRQNVRLGNYLWPDRHNTARAIDYSVGGMLAVAAGLAGSRGLRIRAERTIALTRLDRNPLLEPRYRNDLRWERRDEAWEKATSAKNRIVATRIAYGVGAANIVREGAIAHAKDCGFWSVWMTVFADDAVMRQQLVDAFAGTEVSCFNGVMELVRRPKSPI